LDAIRNNLSGTYLLMNDLNSTTPGYEELASPTANEGKGWEPIGTFDNQFTGTFNGQGYEISDLLINRTDESGIGLFGVVGSGGGVIKDIGVVNATATGGTYGVGGLVGGNAGTVSDCYFTGNVTGEWYVGGLVGSNEGESTVSNSYSMGSVTGRLGGGHVGGLVGRNGGDTVSDSYSSSSVTGDYIVGGLVGWNGATVSNSYSTGNVSGDEYVGGLVGLNDDGAVTNCFWDTETSGQGGSAAGTGKTTAEMQDITTFSGAGWDIVAVANPGTRNTSYIWNTVDDETYPFLSWQPLS